MSVLSVPGAADLPVRGAMNACAMVQRCARQQTGDPASAWAVRETQSSEASYQPAVQTYVPEAEAPEAERPLPAAEWA